MAKWFGAIGYCKVVETSPGVWSEEIIERKYFGDILQANRRTQTSNQVNDNLTISNRISIVSDPFAMENSTWIHYVVLMGAKWKVTDVEFQYPRLVLTVGGVYNG